MFLMLPGTIKKILKKRCARDNNEKIYFLKEKRGEGRGQLKIKSEMLRFLLVKNV
ncbi:unnamed protein product [Meloidogyne enterolobii]|uniref:Uncharacterized protein n=1 Tax=Meloidogyne enterolobii TaxID=390850 RepID=A0ACB0ZN67_MELEN